ncbi:hypothetical protein OEZ85_003945 [Tetradesmus obliquus]|uniref:Acetolactate synthase large subunit n=1 Tax=Tetradesmus obliquus TaxID=3088 RepID=A0ABY8UCT9_TETOB|nr:hypothetical protein OEZ85_003945 [Tetradesmus obliquus]
MAARAVPSSSRGSAPATCADVAIAKLHEGGISVCFANPGTTEMWMVSALEKQRGIRSILGLQEAVCTGACDGYARMARQPALALLHLGPGLGNGLCNLHNARRAGSPVVVMVGDMATWHRAADPPLNQDIEALAGTVSAALRAAPRGKAALLLGGTALLEEGGALSTAGRIAASLGAALLCEPLPGRIERGQGLPHATRLPYFPQEAAAELAQYEVLLLLDVRRPVAGFGYKDGPSHLLKQGDDAIWELDAASSLPEALQLLEAQLPGAAAVRPGVNCRGMFATPHRPALPSGVLTAAALCQAVAALQPAGTILVDESLTSGTAYWEASKGCPPFSHLCLTGGAIGSGPPMATGAAVAAPGRQVINLQADGSAMYTLQALWTQAREQLKVLTIICANNTYAILKVEAMRQRTPGTSSGMTSLSGPAIDWVALATGMGVAAGRTETAEQLAALINQGLEQAGPFLIHAALK